MSVVVLQRACCQELISDCSWGEPLTGTIKYTDHETKPDFSIFGAKTSRYSSQNIRAVEEEDDEARQSHQTCPLTFRLDFTRCWFNDQSVESTDSIYNRIHRDVVMQVL